MHLFRKVRKQLASENKFMKYSRYAVGEIVLVVIGILIALQINNSNQERKDNNALQGYLKSIGLNIESDLKRADFILNKRKEIHRKSELIDNGIGWRVWRNQAYDVKDINYVSAAMKEVISLNYFNPNLSGFESLKNSGFLSKLQGSDLELLLNDYYNLVNEIILEENNYNQLIQDAYSRYSESDFHGSVYLYNPDYKGEWKSEDYEIYRAEFEEILNSPSFISFMETPFSLILKYENIQVLGDVISNMINEGLVSKNNELTAKMERMFDIQGLVGYPKIIDEGAIIGDFNFAGATSNSNQWSIGNFKEGYIRLDFPQYDWAAFFLYNGEGSLDQLKVKDYSSYKTLRMELKGDKGGEQVLVGLKDESNPTDGSETKVEITLTKEWAFYEFPLTSFAPTNLEKVLMPILFAFEKNPRIIYIRNVEYVR